MVYKIKNYPLSEILLGCDTMVALPNVTKDGNMIFAKNSDRPYEECQPLKQKSWGHHHSATIVECEYVNIPQVDPTFRHVGSKPYWCEGYEHGFNEHQVVIGNEAIWSKLPKAEEKRLLGMEVVRFGLERCNTAKKAVGEMTWLIDTYGVGWFENNDKTIRTYDNAYIVADPYEAYIIETAGHEWAMKKVNYLAGISNVHSITTDWDDLSLKLRNPTTMRKFADEYNLVMRKESGILNFEKTFANHDWDERTRALYRKKRSCEILEQNLGNIDVRTMFDILRDHSDGKNQQEMYPFDDKNKLSICMHYTDKIKENTTASLVADLSSNDSRLPVYWVSFYSPCLSVFMPIFIEGYIPRSLVNGDKQDYGLSLWWKFRNLETIVRNDSTGELEEMVKEKWYNLEERFLTNAYEIASNMKILFNIGKKPEAIGLINHYMKSNVNEILTFLDDFNSKFPKRLTKSK